MHLMPLHIETGHPLTGDVRSHPFREVRFVTDQDRTMFEVSIGQDGRSIEIKGVDVVAVDGVLYDSSLAACPNASNSLTIRTVPYDA